MKRPEYVRQIQAVLQQVAPGAEVILFGSEARGDAREDSDIDVLILIDKEKLSYDDKGNIIGPLYDLEIDLDVAINPIIRTRHQWYNRPFKTSFYCNVMNEGIRI
jgi:predicted nucleotidyltransferase